MPFTLNKQNRFDKDLCAGNFFSRFFSFFLSFPPVVIYCLLKIKVRQSLILAPVFTCSKSDEIGKYEEAFLLCRFLCFK